MTIGKWRFSNTELLATTIALIPFYYVLRLVFNAVFFPMELEVREGVSWLHVLAQMEGISIYDHSQLAYFGSHGAVDHLLKTVVHFLIPPLPSQAIVRLFVATLPFCVLAMTYQSLRGVSQFRLAAALLGAAIVYVGMANLRTYNLLVGRPDPTTLSFLALQGAMTARFFHQKAAGVLAMIAYALLMSLAIFTVWRIFPVVGSFWLIAAVSIAHGRFRKAAQFLAISAAVFFAVFLILLFVAFLGDVGLFYDHFIGLFISYLKIGTHGPWQVFPPELMLDSTVRLAVFPALGVLFLAMLFLNHKKDRIPLLCFGLTCACYLLFSYGYNQNKDGAGLHYFSPYTILCWMSLLVLAGRQKSEKWPAILVMSLATYALIVPNWMQISSHTKNMEASREAVGKFRQQLEEWDSKGEIMSETYHLYKSKLGDSIIDLGDGVEDMTNVGFFDKAFADTGKRFFAKVQSGVYKWYLTGGVEAPQTTAYLKQNYTAMGSSPPYDQMNAPGGCVSVINCPIIWQRK